MKKKIIIVSIVVLFIMMLLILIPYIKIDTGSKIIYLKYNDFIEGNKILRNIQTEKEYENNNNISN